MRSKRSNSFKDFYKLFTLRSKDTMFGIKLSRDSFSKEAATMWVLLGLAVIILMIFLTWSVISYPVSRPNSSVASPNAQTATLVFSLKDTKRVFRGEVTPDMTVLDAMIASIQAGQIKMLYSVNRKNKTNITEIGGHRVASNLGTYLNSERIDIKDLNKIVIKPGDTIEVRLD